ncbi:MAG TPA: hypothetical protein VJ276_00390 [Thermoanaerobaculia bacterium]|nr:hypothetical protein [Thermoanaerobaculia bacterium]
MRGAVCSMMLLMMAALCAAAQEWSVEVAPPRKRLVTRNDLVIYCRSDREIDGCTEFLGETLRCECRPAAGSWAMTARAQFVPYMYVVRTDVEEHEQLHIDDLREQVRRYFVDLTARRFDDGESCRGAAEFEMTVFNLRLDLFRKLSQKRLR